MGLGGSLRYMLRMSEQLMGVKVKCVFVYIVLDGKGLLAAHNIGCRHCCLEIPNVEKPSQLLQVRRLDRHLLARGVTGNSKRPRGGWVFRWY